MLCLLYFISFCDIIYFCDATFKRLCQVMYIYLFDRKSCDVFVYDRSCDLIIQVVTCYTCFWLKIILCICLCWDIMWFNTLSHDVCLWLNIILYILLMSRENMWYNILWHDMFVCDGRSCDVFVYVWEIIWCYTGCAVCIFIPL